jgi:hypothetical protein
MPDYLNIDYLRGRIFGREEKCNWSHFGKVLESELKIKQDWWKDLPRLKEELTGETDEVAHSNFLHIFGYFWPIKRFAGYSGGKKYDVRHSDTCVPSTNESQGYTIFDIELILNHESWFNNKADWTKSMNAPKPFQVCVRRSSKPGSFAVNMSDENGVYLKEPVLVRPINPKKANYRLKISGGEFENLLCFVKSYRRV